MPILSYNNVSLSINNKYIIADSFSVQESSPQKPIFNFNNNIPIDYVPSTLKNSVSVSYDMEPGNEPNYTIITGLISDITIPRPSLISIGNCNITGYLNTFNLQLLANGIIKNTASYDIFYPFTGNLVAQNPTGYGLYDTSESSGIAHYWSAQFLSGGKPLIDNNVLQLSYSASITNNPIYTIGRSSPSQIYISSLTENADILTETQLRVGYSGQIIDKIAKNLENLIISGFSSYNYITIPMTGFMFQEVKYDITTDNIILFNISYSRSF